MDTNYTWIGKNDEWGLNGYALRDVPRELIGALRKLRDYEKTNLSPGKLKEIDEDNSLRNLSDFEVFLMTLKRSFADIIMDEESDYDDDIEPEEEPEWCLE